MANADDSGRNVGDKDKKGVIRGIGHRTTFWGGQIAVHHGRTPLRRCLKLAAIIHQQRTRTQFGRKTFSVCGQNIGNSLPQALCLADKSYADI